ncbi:MAG: ABC transporter permease [Bacteroidota bacterium]|nr:ABC transporter permease [Bacteroidota bacterium]
MIKNYFKIALRNLVKNKSFSFINIAGLALSLAAFWFIALFIGQELSYDRYHENADRIYRLASHGNWEADKFDVTGTSALTAKAMKDEFPEVEQTVRINPEGGGILSYNEKHFKEDAVYFTDSTFFKLFTYHFLAGNPANPLAKPGSVVITKSLSDKLFANPSDAINKTIYFDNNSPNLVTGVMQDVPENSHFAFHALRAMPASYTGNWGNFNTYTYVLLKKNADVKNLRAKMPAFIKKHFTSNGLDIAYSIELQPLTSIHLYSHLSYELGENLNINYLYMLSLVGLLILVIAFINYTNINTARAAVRLREVAVRKIIGSTRRHLVSLFLTESLVVILIATILSIFLVTLIMPLFNDLTRKHLSPWYFGGVTSVACLLIFSILGSLIGGLYSALFLSRFKIIAALKNQVGEHGTQILFRKSLIVFQFTVTIVMITASIIIYSQLHFVSQKNLGFNKKQVLTFHLDSRPLRKQVAAFRSVLLQNPQVEAVASAGNPIGNNDIGMMDYSIEKNGVLDPHSNLAYALTIDENFIPAMQIKMMEGRNFNATADSDKVIVNEAFLKKQGWTNGVNKRIQTGLDNSTGKVIYSTIIGVARNFHIYSLQHKIDPMILQMPKSANERDNMYVRVSAHNIPQTLQFLQQTFRKFDQESPFEYHFLDKNFAAQYVTEEKQGEVLLAFTILAICIACLGLFGLIIFSTKQRVKEIGIRKVLGASVQSLVATLTSGLLQLVLLSMLIAIPVAWWAMNKWLQNFAYRIHISWWIFLAAGVTAIIIALITISFQAIKAAVANPVDSLRSE